MASDQTELSVPRDSLRDPATLMQPERLGALKQTRLSFARLLVEKMAAEQWDIGIDRMDVDDDGVGRVVYYIETPSKRFSFGVFSRAPSKEDTDRIIATEWDLWAFLCEGEATPELMDFQYEELPHVLEGRATPEILIWTRANRSSRFFGHVVESLSAGHQPDIRHLARGGYLMRSSGYYGNGLNGTKVFQAMDGDHPLSQPYMAQMLAAYMLRVFGYDLAEEIAAARSDEAVSLDDDIKRYLGTGNSSGLGIVMYVVNHPKQIHTWLRAREIALARAKNTTPTSEDIERFRRLVRRAHQWFDEDESETNEYFLGKDRIADGLERIEREVDSLAAASSRSQPPLWARLCEWAERELEIEIQEVLHSLLLDLYPGASEGLEDSLITSEKTDISPEMTLGKLRSLVGSSYQWALEMDLTRPESSELFWYRSVENEEPRMGIRGQQEYDEYEIPIDIARQVQQLDADLGAFSASDTVAEFLCHHPEHRQIIERVQSLHGLSYAEIRENPLDSDFCPLYSIACLKSFWGISKTHPKSMGWVRGTFFQGAPLPDELREGEQSYWVYPSMPERADHWGES